MAVFDLRGLYVVLVKWWAIQNNGYAAFELCHVYEENNTAIESPFL